jgi:hypothetical protein
MSKRRHQSWISGAMILLSPQVLRLEAVMPVLSTYRFGIMLGCFGGSCLFTGYLHTSFDELCCRHFPRFNI